MFIIRSIKTRISSLASILLIGLMICSFVSVQAQMNYNLTWELGWGSNGGPDPAGLDTIVFPFGIQNRLAAPASGDLDNDGDIDMIISNQQGEAFFYENIGTSTQPHWGRRPLPSLDTIRVGKGQNINQLHVELADIDGDGDLDLFCGSRWEYGSASDPANQKLDDIVFFRNIGTISTPVFTLDKTIPGLQNQQCAEFTSPCLADIDGDGDLDLLTLGSDSSAYFENIGTSTSPNFVRYYKNDPQNPLHGWSYANMLIPSASLNDLDGDGDLDLFVCDDGGLPWVVENEGTATVPDFDSLTLRTPPAILDTIDFGQFPRHEIADFNNDGILDIIVSPFTPVKFYWFKGASNGISVSLTTKNISCHGGNDGSAIANVSGAIGPVTYLWSNSASTDSIGGLAVGKYIVTVTDSLMNTAIDSISITAPDLLVSSTAVNSAITCNGLNDGVALASATGGTSPYTYTWNTGETSATETNLGANTYSVTITDQNGCTDSSSIIISQPVLLISSATVDQTPTCNTCTDGAATASATGGTTSYTYAWSNGATTASITGTSVGTYSVTITDQNGCTDSTSLMFTAGPLASVIVDSNVTCNGLSNGGATASATGGTTPYTYSWSNAVTTTSITGVMAGTYTVTITDQSGLTSTSSITITEPVVLTSSTAVDSNITCNGFSDGGATASASGGTTPYTYAWSNSATTASITGVIAGTYSITISDHKGCTSNSSTTITEPSVLIAASVVDSNISCNGSSNGGATASASGGTTPYTYTWSNSATTASITGVIAGTYSITITDHKGCTSNSSTTITEPSVLIATSVVDSNISCNGLSNGGATASASGGITPYTYAWSNGSTTSSISGVIAGTYTATITDANGCTSTSSATITEPTQLIATSVIDSNISCNGLSNGGATATASGGTTPYTYSWSNTATNAGITGLNAGTYSITITDHKGCTDSSSVIITEPTPLVTSTIVDSNTTCSSNTDGGATASATGGTAGYSYSWNNTAITASITGVVANTYTVTITDANGCFNIDTIDIVVEDLIRPQVITQSTDVYLDINGNATITTTDIDNGSSDACGIQSMQLDISSFNCSNMGPNTVELLVTDVNGNSDSATAIVTVIDSLAPTINGQNINAYLNANGQISINASDIDNGSIDNCNISTTTISTSNFTCAEIGSNNVDLIVEDVNGNIDTATFIVTVLDTIDPIVNTSNTIVYLDASGQASITVSDIDNNSVDNCGIQSMTLDSTHFDCSETGFNTVILTASDASGNSNTQSATVTVLDTIRPTVITQNHTAYLNQSGIAIIQEMDIDNGSFDNCSIQSYTLNQSYFTCSDTGSNTVTLEVTDVNGNIDSANAIVTILDTLNPNVNTQNINVYLDVNGQASITPSDIDNGSTDNCAVQNLSLDNTSFDCSAVGSNTVTLTVMDVSGNSNSASAIVTVIDTISPTVFTQDITIYLDASGMANILASNIDNGSLDNCAVQSQSVDISTFNCNDLGNNTVVLSVTDVNGNIHSQTAIVTVVDSITPKITCPVDFSNCGPEITVDNPVVSDNCNITLQLVSGIASGDTFPVGKTTNTYEVVDISGNKATCTVDITRFPQPVVTVRDDSTVYYEQSLTLYSESEFVVEYQWSPSIYLSNSTNQQPICTPRETTEYTLIGKSADGCYSEPKSVYITVHPGGELQIPNTFSPNGDGYNDYFEIPGIAYLPEMRMTIFNRNGEILYQKKGYQNDWDGTSNGKVLPVATYYYVIDLGNNQKPIKGDITIIK